MKATKILLNLKFYVPAGMMFLGLFLVFGGVVGSEKHSDPVPLTTERDRLTATQVDIDGNTRTTCENWLEGRATINKSMSVPKGVIMVFEPNNASKASTFGDIASDGRFRVRNVPTGQVALVLRPDTETVLNVSGSAIRGNFKINARGRGPTRQELCEGKFNFASARPTETAFTSFLKGLPEDKRSLLVGAISKYGNPKSHDAFTTTIVEGTNRINIDFQVP